MLLLLKLELKAPQKMMKEEAENWGVIKILVILAKNKEEETAYD